MFLGKSVDKEKMTLLKGLVMGINEVGVNWFYNHAARLVSVFVTLAPIVDTEFTVNTIKMRLLQSQIKRPW